MILTNTIRKHGVIGTAKKASALALKKSGWYHFKFRRVDKYQNPTGEELILIEQELTKLGIPIKDYVVKAETFHQFKQDFLFPEDYHGGIKSGVWDEKLLEHFIAFERLGLKNYRPQDIYIDMAACGSPWAKILKEKQNLASSYAIDVSIAVQYAHLSYYKKENAISTSFSASSVKGASLQCAYEMFTGNDDIDLLKEAARILSPGGKMIIVPLYMHTHYCSYSTPEYWGKGFSDQEAKEYVRLDCFGVPSSRKYDAFKLKERVLEVIQNLGMSYQLYALRNKDNLGSNIYCHFILEIIK